MLSLKKQFPRKNRACITHWYSMLTDKIVDCSFYERDTRLVAIELIGKVLVFKSEGKSLCGEIVETEAYLGEDDPASHAYRGMTPRNRVMFGAPGFSYIYFTYGFHHCFNVVTEKEGKAGAVLIRALRPLSEIELMKRRRGTDQLQNLTSGPGKLTQAFGMTREHSGLDLTQNGFHIEETSSYSKFQKIGVSKRIGIREGKDFLYRFFLEDSPFISVKPNKSRNSNGLR